MSLVNPLATHVLGKSASVEIQARPFRGLLLQAEELAGSRHESASAKKAEREAKDPVAAKSGAPTRQGKPGKNEKTRGLRLFGTSRPRYRSRVMTGFLRNSLHHHGKFFTSLAIGGSAWAGAAATHLRMPFAVGGDLFFLSYIAAFWLALGHLDSGYLKNRAKVEDEGAGVVSLIILAAVAYTCTAIFATLNDKTSDDPIWLAILLAGAPLGWFVIHFNEAAHYSNLYYREHHRGSRSRKALDFHDGGEPGIQDFLYFSFVIGMTSQTSDTDVLTTSMRRAVTWHSVVSFFFNAILIAMAVNAVVSRAG